MLSTPLFSNHQSAIEQISDESIRYRLNAYFSKTNELQIRKQEEADEVKNRRRPFFVDNEILSFEMLFTDPSNTDVFNVDQLSQFFDSQIFKSVLISGHGSNHSIAGYTNELLKDNKSLVELLEKKL